ncbi:ubiquinone anaerobic biosynthesis accessory factor UbiT [Maricaulis sp.]|uniref:ubiquinone anaerobic biosynthesis accessory factor UbiT n=1 Tax=Maricaulis sp. TaxID=1486257 RepID=UPI003A94782A
MMSEFLARHARTVSRGIAAKHWPRGPVGRGAARAACLALQPAALMLTASLRRLARQRPEVFDRLGPARQARILICPAGLPMAFLVSPDGARGSVSLVPASAPVACEARIEAPLDLLLQLMQGSEDGDAAFFAAELWIEGETASVLSLRNAIEEAELTLADLLPLPALPSLPPLPPAPWRPAMPGSRS